ncbi:hypothetical protein RclHR1_10990001 [Rhizophagus clarus]|uniref:Uncharacterized protein n=1 Tax=Rhizophagus clarus TaxID=94130 RepID=A0A2Z6Q305_9GLOM|nr:hypothetical protein RclHR1_10990001 [Rhizophagus clarus]GET04537.1 hypothetical protein GLOIN_2v1812413 [Rhizophagus clarus]
MDQFEEREKELYSKECVAESINFVVGEVSEDATSLMPHERFSCNLATILARDKEVVAVRLKVLPNGCEIYLFKNFAWLEYDYKYINKIKNYLKIISKNAPMKTCDVERNFYKEVMSYCSVKLESRLKKLKNDIQKHVNNRDVNSFKEFISTKLNEKDRNNSYKISKVCLRYYRLIKNDSNIHPKFLRHIKKVGSYFGSMKEIIECARNIHYKPLFTYVRVYYGRPEIINNHPIYSWENIIKRYTEDDHKYNIFTDRCLAKPEVMERMKKVYTDKATRQQQQQ